MPTTTPTVNVSVITLDGTDPTKTSWGARLTDQKFFVLANGTSADETFDAEDIATATKTLMTANGRGLSVDMGAGDDTVIGSAYADNITGGAGTNYIDGGANGGTQPDGSKPIDVLDVYVANAAAASAVTVVALDNTSAGADAAAFTGGYQYKVTNGSGETNYVKNVEQIVVRLVADRSFVSAINLAVNVREVASDAVLTNYMHLAWADGGNLGGSFNAATDVSAATQALMATQGRGVLVHMGSGNDTVTGSAFGDNIDAGAGVNYIDGGANGGSPPWGGKAEDVLQMVVASQAASDAVQVVSLDGSGSATDIAAFGGGYAFKIVDASGGQTNYVKGIERVSVQIQNGSSFSYGREIALSIVAREANLSDANIANFHRVAWINGTGSADTIDASGDTALLSTALKTNMATTQRGVWIDGGSGNDTITGTAYADTVRNGSGNAKVDGGANAYPAGHQGRDIFEIEVASQAAMDAIVVSVSDDPNYSWMVTYGSGSTQKDYLKNIEAISVFITGGTGRWIPLAAIVNEVAAGTDVTNYMHLAWVNGSDQGDNFSVATDVSAATQARMATNGRGVYINLGAGNDTVAGSAYGDHIDVGSGTNYVDGGANGGAPPWGGKAEDVLQMTVASQAASDALQVLTLSASGGSAADNTAFGNGYTHKVLDSLGNQVNYIKGIERVSVIISDGTTSSFGRNLALAVTVQEANLSDANVANYYQLAWVNGTEGADTIDLSGDTALLSAALKTNMASTKRGVWVNGGAGDDVITGTAAVDNFVNGAGNSKIDGGTNLTTGGRIGQDVFQIEVANTAAMNAIVISASDDANYTWMVTYGSGSTQKDYLKNIEAVSVNVTGGGVGKWVPLALSINEVTAGADVTNNIHLAWVNGTELADTFNAATDISAATQALMTTHGRGVYVNTGAGNDTVAGTAFGDNFDVGSGTNYVDGGANGGTLPWGGKAEDVLQMTVASQAALNALQVLSLTASGGSTADNTAFTNGYTHKILDTVGNQVNYIKGIERISVSVYDGTTYSFGRDIALAISVQEANLNDANVANFYQLAWVRGTDGADTINLGSDTTLLSTALKANMASTHRGVRVDGGAGNDVITGTAAVDNFVNGAGNSKIDGGANVRAGGLTGQDIFQIEVANTAAMNTVVVSASDDADYTWMVTYGSGSSQKDYLKNIEAVIVNVTGGGASKWMQLALNINEVAAGADVSNNMHLAWVNGTDLADTFNAATDISSATQTLMATHGRGVYVNTGAGNDTVAGTAYGDNIDVGSGTNYVDGGANGGTPPWGGKAEDVLQMTVASLAASNAVQVVSLTATGGSTADNTAFSNGFTHKIVDSVGNQINYVKGIERVSIMISDGSTNTFGRDIALALSVREANLNDANIANFTQLAWVRGTDSSETMDLSGDTALLSSALKANMTSTKRGVWVDGGAGNDVITGSAASDYFINGSGNSKIDGGTHLRNGGQNGQDVFQIEVANVAAVSAVVVSASDDPNYTWMVTYGNGSSQKDYLKNIEGVSIHPAGGGAGKWIPLVPSITDFWSPNQAENGAQIVSVVGSEHNDIFNAATDLSADTLAHLASAGRGMRIDMGAGNNIVSASAFADRISVEVGNNYIDGGANGGTSGALLFGAPVIDVLQMTVPSAAAAAAVEVQLLNGSSASGVDNAAYANGYTHKVVDSIGGQVNYVKGVERLELVTFNGTYHYFQRIINLAVIVTEEVLTDPNLDQKYYLAFVQGTNNSELIDLSGDSALLSTPLKDAMASSQVGLAVLGEDGNDVVIGTAYNDYIGNGRGNNKIDGGAEAAHNGISGRDTFQIHINSLNVAPAMNAIAIVPSDDPNYTWMVTYGTGSTEKDYLKNVEAVQFSMFHAQKTVALKVLVDEKQASLGSTALAASRFLAEVTGTEADDIVDAHTALSTAVRGLMQTHSRGVNIDLRAGNDTAAGSDYVDNFEMGAGTNFVDGRGHAGRLTSSSAAGDNLDIVVTTQAQADAVAVHYLSSASTGADAAAYAAGYKVKIVNGSTETDYLKNVETVSVYVWNDLDNNGVRFTEHSALSVEMTLARLLTVGVAVTEVSASSSSSELTDKINMAWGSGSAGDDTFDAATDVSAATRAIMASYGTGVFVETFAGNDTIIGSGYGDTIIPGTGTNYVDGGAHGGPLTGAARGEDVLRVETISQAACNAVQVVELSASGGSATDIAAFGNGYTFKVIDSIGNQINYVKGIERVDVVVRDGTTTGLGRGFQLAVRVNESNLNDTNSANYTTIASVSGTDFADVVDLSGDTALLSSTIKANMASTNRGVMFDLGGGNDVITGTAAADYIINGSGNAKVDGGGNISTDGKMGNDVFQISLTTAAEVNAVTVSPSDDPNYSWMVTYGSGSAQKDYLKNIEAVSVAGSSGVTGRWIRLAMSVNERSAAQAAAGEKQLVYVNGTDQGETFNAATHVSGTTRALMTTYQAGVYAELGGGNDTVIGSAYGDTIDVGSGTNYVDGGANGGNNPDWGTKPSDVLQMQLASKEAFDALQVTHLNGASANATDNTAFANGYTEKVHDLVAGTVNYIKGIEAIWANYPLNGASASGYIGLVTRVQEVNLNDASTATLNVVAFITGTIDNDTIDLSGDTALLSSAIKANMATTQRGVLVNGSAGSDTMVGTAHADTFYNGSGNSRIDGGANSERPTVSPVGDVFSIYLSTAAEVDAVVVSASDDPNYQWMVTYGGTSTQKDYLKNIELVSVNASGASRSIWLPAPPVSTEEYVATIDVTTGNFNAATDLSAANQALVDGVHRGIKVVAGSGDDRIVGTAYGDEIDVGLGVNYIDGGANGGTSLIGNPALDVLKMRASSTNALNGMTLTVLTASSGSATDISAFNNGYTHKIHDPIAQVTNYMKGIEKIVISPIGGADFTTPREIFLTVSVIEVNLATSVDWSKPLATIQGGALAETIDASSGAGLLSAALRSAMDARKMGVSIDGGAANDTITGTVQNDVISGGAGNDVIDGGAGLGDKVNYFVPDSTGTYSYGLRADGTPVIKLGEVELFTYVRQADGSVMVTGLPGTVAAGFGTDVLRNVEAITLSVQMPEYTYVAFSVPVGALAWHLDVAGGTFTGSVWDDVLDASVEFPTVVNTATAPYDAYRITFQPGLGNDTMVGTPSSDHFHASPGNDTINGAGSLFDEVFVDLQGGTGKVSTQLEADGSIAVKRDATTIFTVTENANGSMLVTGVAGTEGAYYGAELLTNIESISFGHAVLGLAPRSYLQGYGTALLPAYWLGSFRNDTVNLATTFPTLTGSDGATAKPDLGNDSVIGTAGNDLVHASAGTDTVDGAGGSDTLLIDLSDIVRSGAFNRTTAANGDVQLTMGDVVLVNLHTNADSSILVTGSGAAAAIGTELVRNIEAIQVQYKFDNAGANIGVAGIDLLSGAMMYRPGSGNDILTGTAQNDIFWNSYGTDSIDGGQGVDTFVVDMMNPFGQTITMSTAANGDRLVMRNDVLFFTIHRQADGDLLVTGSGNVLGTHVHNTVLHNVEYLNIEYFTGTTTTVLSIELVGIQLIAT